MGFPPVPVLNYHHVHDGAESYFRVTPSTLRAQMELLLNDGYLPVGPDQLIALKDKSAAAGKYVLVTFDDGYEDFFHCAWPVLKEMHIPVTLFIISDYVGGWNDWDRIRVSRCRHMNLDQLRALQAEGVSFGSHTRTHRALSFVLRRAALLSEIRDSKYKLEDTLGVQVRVMAYPGGHVSRRVRNLTARHYDLGFATHLGACARFGDPYRIPRFDPSFCGGLDTFRQQMQVYSGHTTAGDEVRIWQRAGDYVGRIARR